MNSSVVYLIQGIMLRICLPSVRQIILVSSLSEGECNLDLLGLNRMIGKHHSGVYLSESAL